MNAPLLELEALLSSRDGLGLSVPFLTFCGGQEGRDNAVPAGTACLSLHVHRDVPCSNCKLRLLDPIFLGFEPRPA